MRRTFEGQWTIEVIDLLENPGLAKGGRILATPALVRRLPEPVRKIIGTLADTERVLVGLDLRPRKPERTMMVEGKTTTGLFEDAAAGGESQKFILSLFVAGMTPRSLIPCCVQVGCFGRA